VDVSRFRNASAFASWLELCPEKATSGGKVLDTRSRQVKNRVALALRGGAQCLYQPRNYLGEFYRRMRCKRVAGHATDIPLHFIARRAMIAKSKGG